MPLLKADQLELAEDVETAKRWAADHPQGLWIIDVDTFPASTLSSLKDEQAGSYLLPSVAITTTFEEYSAAVQQGMEVVLLRGFSIEDLTSAIFRAVKKLSNGGTS